VIPTLVLRFIKERKITMSRLLGQTVRANIGGHMTTILLTDYDDSDDSYFGLAIRCRSMNSNEKPPVFEAVPGLRQYPTADRPDYSFQFVVAGEDESPLLAIAQKNADATLEQVGGRPQPQQTTPEQRKKDKHKGQQS